MARSQENEWKGVMMACSLWGMFAVAWLLGIFAIFSAQNRMSLYLKSQFLAQLQSQLLFETLGEGAP